MKSKIETVYCRHGGERICQGDILNDFTYPEWISREGSKIKVKNRIMPFLIILTQDCDLERDHVNRNTPKEMQKTQDKYLQSILVCSGYYAEQFRNGEHLNKLGLTMEYQNKNKWKTIIQNDNPRYHFLGECPKYQIPDLVIDFKHYYTVPIEILNTEINNHYVGTINELFRESLSQRFAHYLSRVGLPL
ncbi:MAG: hypothetical protein ACC614_02600 [Methanobacterium formicicum]|uniref:hypothetical protein n=1 Tax=Methanobacterium formicicum TaxID=2162 RepID=UPI0035315B1C